MPQEGEDALMKVKVTGEGQLSQEGVCLKKGQCHEHVPWKVNLSLRVSLPARRTRKVRRSKDDQNGLERSSSVWPQECQFAPNKISP